MHGQLVAGARQARVVGVDGGAHQGRVIVLEARLVEAESLGQSTEDLGVRQCLAHRGDDRCRPLQPVLPVGAVDVVVLEVAGRRQHHVGMAHGVGHDHVDAADEQVLAQQRAAQAVLVRVGAQRVVVVDHQGVDGRVHGRVEQPRAGVDDVDQAGLATGEVGAFQCLVGIGKGGAVLGDDAGTDPAEGTAQGRQCADGANAGATVATAFHAVADGHGDVAGGAVGVRQGLDGGPRQVADTRGVVDGPGPRRRQVVFQAVHVAGDEVRVDGAAPLELGRQRQRQHHVGAGQRLHVQCALFGDAHAFRIDHHHLRAACPGRLEHPCEVQVGDGHVVAPDHHQVGFRGLLRGHAGGGAEQAGIGGAAHRAAQRSAVQAGGAEPVEEARGHGAAGQPAVGAGIVQRHHRFRAVALDGRGQPQVHPRQSLVPGDCPELAAAATAGTDERRGQPALAVDEVRVVAGHFLAHHAGGEGIRVAAADPGDATVLDGDVEAAGVGAVQRANAGQDLALAVHGGDRFGAERAVVPRVAGKVAASR